MGESTPGRGDHRDAVFFSPHRFVGGPPTPACWWLLAARPDRLSDGSPRRRPAATGELTPASAWGRGSPRRPPSSRRPPRRPQLIALAKAHGCRAIAIEDLEFADARAQGRETFGRGRRGRRFRRVVAGIPTGRFRDRLTQMCANQGLWVVAVDPAYTSQWGREHWLAPMQETGTTTVTVDQAAAVVIGRRSLRYRARRRPCVALTHRRMGVGESYRPGRSRSRASGGSDPPARRPGSPIWGMGPAAAPGAGFGSRWPKTVRSRPSATGSG
jgi:hypothetical protein